MTPDQNAHSSPPRAYRVVEPTPAERIAAARELARGPGRGLTLAGWVGLVGNVALLVWLMPVGAGASLTLPRFLVALPFLTAGLVCASLTLLSGACLRNGRFRDLAYSGMVLGCFPLHVGAVLGIPFAVRGFAAMSDPDVLRRFDRWG